MAEHGWSHNEWNDFQFYKIDVTLTSDPDETLVEIQVPVRPAVLAAPPAASENPSGPGRKIGRARMDFARKENIES